MLKIEERIFSEKEFKVTKLPASQGVLLKFKLVNLFGPAVGSLTSLFTDSKGDELDYEKLGEIVGEAFANIDPMKAHQMLTSTCEMCFVDGKKQKFDFMFVDMPMTDIYKVFGWVLEVNFADFFGGKDPLSVIEKKVSSLKASSKS